MRTNIAGLLIISLSTLPGLLLCGCEGAPPGPFVPKPLTASVVYCNDYTGHLAGAKPWIDGGNCCCTPTPELMAQYQKDGFCTGQTAQQLIERYRAAGIRLKEDGHQRCNGLCEGGPHVVLGGKCLCPPTPGTDYHDRVVTGRGAVSRTPTKS